MSVHHILVDLCLEAEKIHFYGISKEKYIHVEKKKITHLTIKHKRTSRVPKQQHLYTQPRK